MVLSCRVGVGRVESVLLMSLVAVDRVLAPVGYVVSAALVFSFCLTVRVTCRVLRSIGNSILDNDLWSNLMSIWPIVSASLQCIAVSEQGPFLGPHRLSHPAALSPTHTGHAVEGQLCKCACAVRTFVTEGRR